MCQILLHGDKEKAESTKNKNEILRGSLDDQLSLKAPKDLPSSLRLWLSSHSKLLLKTSLHTQNSNNPYLKPLSFFISRRLNLKSTD